MTMHVYDMKVYVTVVLYVLLFYTNCIVSARTTGNETS